MPKVKTLQKKIEMKGWKTQREAGGADAIARDSAMVIDATGGIDDRQDEDIG